MQKKDRTDHDRLTMQCLTAFIQAGTLDLSLDQLATSAGMSKRMLVHYFGNRETLEDRALTLLEIRLRAQFAPDAFPASTGLQTIVKALWARTTAAESRGVLLLIMDVSRRAWNGSSRAKTFYKNQQDLWVELLLNYSPDRVAIEQILQLFQGATLAFLITGDGDPGHQALQRLTSIAQS